VSLSILTNIAALQAQSQLSFTQANLQQALAQLSSGSKINSGADDAAGLSIANGMQAGIGALTQSVQNATDGIGVLQTADGALGQVNTLLDRAITLATEASNGGLTPNQTAALDNEFQSILTQIDKIGSTTTFNGSQAFSTTDVTPYLSDGSSGNMLGAATISIGTLTTSGLLNSGTPATDAGNTLTLTANVSDGDTIDIGNTTYTFTSGASSGTNVHIGNLASDTLTNLASAVNNNASDTTVHASASGNILTLTATTAGSAGNNLEAASSLVAAPGPTGSWATSGTSGDLGGGANATNASSTLTLSGNVNDGATILIGSTTYTFRDSASIAGDVQIGGDASQTAFNLAAAINGTDGVNTTANASESAARSGSSVTFTAKSAGANGNLLAASGTLAGTGAPTGTWSTTGSAGYMGGGVDPTSAQSALTLSGNVLDGDTILIGSTTYTFRDSASVAGDVQIGSDASHTLSNLAQAVNGNGLNSANASESASASGTSITFTAKTAGTGGNLLSASGTLAGVPTPDGTFSSSGSTGFLGGGADVTTTSGYVFIDNTVHDGSTIAIGGTTYTFKATLDSNPNEIKLVSGNDGQTLQNLKDAINGVNNNGTEYTAGTSSDSEMVTGAVTFFPGPYDSYCFTLTAKTAGAAVADSVGAGSVGIWFTGWGSPCVYGRDAAPATAQLTLNTKPTAGETVTIGQTTYVFSSSPHSWNEVQIGSTVADTLTNLVNTINNNLFEATVTAVANNNVLTLTSNLPGAAGNSLAASGTLATPAGTWSSSAGELAGGSGTATANFGVAQESNNDTLTIGSTTYTFVTSITGNNQVLIGADAQVTWQHLVEAVNGSATGKGTDYSSNLNANTQAKAIYLGPDGAWGHPNWADLLIQALSPGSWGNGVAINFNGSPRSLSGGSDSPTTASNTLTLTSNLIAGDSVTLGSKTYTFQSAAPSSAGQVQIGTDAATTLQNLMSAVNGNGLNGANADLTASASGNQITITANNAGTAGDYLAAYGTLLASGASVSSWSTTGSAGYLGGGTAGSNATSSLSLPTNVADGSTVQVGSTTYTFRNAASASGDVQIGSDAAHSLTNLAAAVNGDSLNSVNPAGSAAAVGTTITFTSKTAGSAGDNTQATGSLTSSGGTVSSWTTTGSAGYLGGGTNASAATASLTLTSNLQAGSTARIGNTTYTFISGASNGTNVHVDTTAAATLANLAAVINGNAGDTTVHASAVGSVLTLTATTAGTGGNSLAATGTLTSQGGGSAGTWSSNGGKLTGGTDASGGGAPLDLNSPADAQAALLAVNTGIGQVASWRGTLGAYINQLHAVSNVIMAEAQNLTSASSGITDADVATTVANMTKYNVLESTGMAALRESNQAEQAVLKLLQ